MTFLHPVEPHGALTVQILFGPTPERVAQKMIGAERCLP
jgi:hypothetical protein